jgi:hypothetical protein
MVPWALCPVFMSCVLGLIFGGIEGVGSRFHLLHSRTHFLRYRARRVPFSYFARPDSFSAVPMASCPAFMFCVPELIFGGNEGVVSRFYVLRSQTLFRRCGRRRVPFSCFQLPDPFWAVPMALGPIFMFCVPVLIFGGSEGVGSRFHVLRSRTPFRRFQGRRVPFSSFAFPYSFSAVPRASGPVFMFCVLVLVFGGTEGVWSRFHVLRSWTCFRRYRGRRVPFSYFALPESFSSVPMSSGPVFMYCVTALVFGGTEGLMSCFHVLRSRTRFRRYRGSQVRFNVLHSRTHFLRYRGRRFPFSYFARPDSFLVVPMA